MTIRAEDLPLELRRRLGIDTADTAANKSRATSRAGVGMGARCPGTCATCGQHFDRYTAFEKHSRPGHRRWAIDLSQPTDTDDEMRTFVRLLQRAIDKENNP